MSNRHQARRITELVLAVMLVVGACQTNSDKELDSIPTEPNEEGEVGVQSDASFRHGVEPGCIRVGGDVDPPRRIRYVPPEFTPDPTVRTRQQFLMYDVVIGPDGRISNVQLARPFDEVPPWPAIHQSALEAIRQWRYEPTLLDGAAVAVCMLVTVTAEVRR